MKTIVVSAKVTNKDLYNNKRLFIQHNRVKLLTENYSVTLFIITKSYEHFFKTFLCLRMAVSICFLYHPVVVPLSRGLRESLSDYAHLPPPPRNYQGG